MCEERKNAKGDDWPPGLPDAYYYYHYDGSGNVTCITDADKDIMALYEYDAFGNIITTCGSLVNDFLFSTQKANNNSGWHMYMFRNYDPQLGRWTQRDPIGLAGGTNLYAFCYNDPVDFVDPYGEWGWVIIGAIVGAIAGGITAAVKGKSIVRGAAIGAFSGAVTAATFGAVSGAAAGLGAVGAGIVGGTVAGAVGAGVSSMGDQLTDECPGIDRGKLAKDMAIGGALGGILGPLSGVQGDATPRQKIELALSLFDFELGIGLFD